MKCYILRLLGLTLLSVYIQSALCEDHFILRAPPASVPAIASRHGFALTSPPDTHGFTLVTKGDDRASDEVVAEVKSDTEVLGIERDRTVHVPETRPGIQVSQSTAAILDALSARRLVQYFGGSVWSSYVRQPAATLTRLDDTHQELASGAGIVALIDTGVDPSQPILRTVLVPGYDFVNQIPGVASELTDLDQSTAAILDQSTAAILDKNTIVQINQSTAAILDQSTAAILDTRLLPAAFGHGTMVAGIIHLVAPTAQIMPLKVFKGDGSANMSDIVRAIYFAVDNGAQVINMSFSMADSSLELMRAVNYATEHNVTCVASAGNDGSETLVYPAAFQNVIGVASTDNQDKRSSFSNFGAAVVSLAAPGEGIITIYPGGNYAVVSGTSFSTPFVSGGAALMIKNNRTLSPFDSAQGFFSGAKKLTPGLGYGRLDLFQAVRTGLQSGHDR